MAIGRLHLVLLHFPIGLAVAAALGDALWAITRRRFLHHAALYCLVLAALLSVPTALTGNELLEGMESGGGLSGQIAEDAEAHEALGFTAMGVLLAAAALGLWRWNRLRGPWLAGYAVLMLAVAVLITLAGHYGGRLAFGPDYLWGGP